MIFIEELPGALIDALQQRRMPVEWLALGHHAEIRSSGSRGRGLRGVDSLRRSGVGTGSLSGPRRSRRGRGTRNLLRSRPLPVAWRRARVRQRSRTRGRGLYDLTARVQAHIPENVNGLCNVFIHHTSASLVITENADPEVHQDLERWISRVVPDGDPLFRHVAEGPDDMPAHVRAMLMQSFLAVPVEGGRLMLGTWQGIYLWEHRTAPHLRCVTVSVSA